MQRGAVLSTEGYRTAANDEAEIALGIHHQPGNTPIVATGEHYPVSFAPDTRWSLSVNMGLKSTVSGTDFAGLYKVVLRMFGSNGQLRQTLELTKRNGDHFFATPNQKFMVPVVAQGGNDVLQLLLNPADYAYLFEGAYVSDAGAVVGAYSFELTAARIGAIATPLSVKVFADPQANAYSRVQLVQTDGPDVEWDSSAGVEIPFLTQVRVHTEGGLPVDLSADVEYDVELPVGITLKETISGPNGVVMTNTTLTVPAGLGRSVSELHGVLDVPADWAGGSEVVMTLSLNSEPAGAISWTLVD